MNLTNFSLLFCFTVGTDGVVAQLKSVENNLRDDEEKDTSNNSCNMEDENQKKRKREDLEKKK